MTTKERIFRVGSRYIDCGYIPRIVVETDGEQLLGRSLIDGTIGSCSIRYCAPQWIHKIIADRWVKTGPLNKQLKQYLKDFYNHPEWGNGRKIWWKE